MENSANVVFDEVQRQYLPSVIDKIKLTASESAAANGRENIDYVDAFRAFEAHFAKYDHSKYAIPEHVSFFRENSFVIIVTIMTLMFGAMGLIPYIFSSSDPSKFGYKPDVFLDIAKLFAGVIVGGAAGAAAASPKTKAKT